MLQKRYTVDSCNQHVRQYSNPENETTTKKTQSIWEIHLRIVIIK
jgi:hypothetical protein